MPRRRTPLHQPRHRRRSHRRSRLRRRSHMHSRQRHHLAINRFQTTPRGTRRRPHTPMRQIRWPVRSALRRGTPRCQKRRQYRSRTLRRSGVRRHLNPRRRSCPTPWISLIHWHRWRKLGGHQQCSQSRHHRQPHRWSVSGRRVRRYHRRRHGMPTRSPISRRQGPMSHRQCGRPPGHSTMRPHARHHNPCLRQDISRNRPPRTRLHRPSTSRRICHRLVLGLQPGQHLPTQRAQGRPAPVRPLPRHRSRQRQIKVLRWLPSSKAPNSAAPRRPIHWP